MEGFFLNSQADGKRLEEIINNPTKNFLFKSIYYVAVIDIKEVINKTTLLIIRYYGKLGITNKFPRKLVFWNSLCFIFVYSKIVLLGMKVLFD